MEPGAIGGAEGGPGAARGPRGAQHSVTQASAGSWAAPEQTEREEEEREAGGGGAGGRGPGPWEAGRVLRVGGPALCARSRGPKVNQTVVGPLPPENAPSRTRTHAHTHFCNGF